MDKMVNNGINEMYKKTELRKLIDALQGKYTDISRAGQAMIEQYPDLTPEQINDLYEELCERAELDKNQNSQEK